MPEPTAENQMIGERVATYRRIAGISQEELARRVTVELQVLLAGGARERAVDQAHVSRIESGRLALATRHMWIAFARALGVSIHDLTAQPTEPRTAEQLVFHTLAPRIRRALYNEEDPATEPRDTAALASSVRQIEAAQMAADWDTMGEVLPPLLLELAAAARDSRPAGLLYARALVRATLCCHLAGYVDLAQLCADRAVTLAMDSGDPVYSAGAAFADAQAALACGAPKRSLLVAEAGAELLQNAQDSVTSRHGLAGMLHLHAGLSAAAIGIPDLAADHIREAADLAREPGDSWGLEFGAPNVQVWQLGVAVEALDWGGAVAASAAVDPGTLRSPDRTARWHVDTARAKYGMADFDGVIAELNEAMAASPRLTRVLPYVRDIVKEMVRAKGRRGSAALQQLVTSVGVDPVS